MAEHQRGDAGSVHSSTRSTAPGDGPPDRGGPERRGPEWRYLAVVATIAVVWVASDQALKNLAVANLPEGESVPVIDGVLAWHLVRNPGAAFSMASGMTWVFTLLATGVAVAVCVFARRIRSLRWSIALGLVLGGTVGNLLDRIFREPGFPIGHVVDYISTPWMVPAVYNLADIGIVTGMASIVLLTLLDIGLDGHRGSRGSDAVGDDASEAGAAP